MNSQIERLIKDSVAKLTLRGVETSAFEVRLLLAEVLGCEAAEVLAHSAPLTPEQLNRFEEFTALRGRHVPADKIIGRRGFYKYDFAVSRDVLSPRPDTEILVEAAVAGVRRSGCRSVLELGVGSGCVVLSLLAECPRLHGVGVDISAAALDIAAQNARALGVDGRITFRRSSWFDADFVAALGRQFEMIVSNPPYIASAEIAELDAEVREYDPLPALDGGPDGLDSYRRIAEVAPELLTPGGRIYLEVGENQAETVARIFEAAGLRREEVLEDLAGIKRCVILKK